MADENQSAVFNFVDDDTESCPVRRTLDLLQGKWNVYVIYELQKADSIRFGELKRKIGSITNNMLTSTLRELEDQGLVHREQFNEIPPHVEYSLTESGKAMFPIFMAMGDWGNKYLQ
jgi:DNA-binding HxlR family transcriptional regulator